MELYVVQEGDTINDIANLYGVPVDRILLDNGYEAEGILLPGQVLVITFPQKIYTVQDGDTLQEIANKNDITVLELLRNNPYLSEREYIYPGETLIISYGEKIRRITTSGYAREFVDRNNLRKTLPYLTYLSIFGYRVMEGGTIEETDDEDILLMAKTYGVAPILIITTLSTLGQIDVQSAYNILNNEDQMDKLIDNLIVILKKKGYYGINIAYELLSNVSLSAYETFNTKAYTRFKEEGFIFFVTISPSIIFTATEISFEKIDYTKIAQLSDGVIILTYLWGSYLGPPAPIASVSRTNEFLDFIESQISPEKIVTGLLLIAYDWELPYIIGLSNAKSLSLEAALEQARQYHVVIQFDEESQTPFYKYNTAPSGIPVNHVVWFINGISINSILKIIVDRGLNGSGLWNVMSYVPQLWSIINTQFEVEKIPLGREM
ncbi:LysM peptidoglycan-binding domain-containing protein [Anaerocolumna sedimenticola]|uniref:LysM peptidoglycan-binding domain-containing protein n=1 Tax=Anaerocolumna sedimenticola TaxID=2696063 RepID=A0A6P1TT92_9FIRM|nr:LysM peptidoglycan-binding domain-containing protein [Anaerocolumna sedimenticola]QHQ63429.1 LysM peptidoglycan-binding domain-containing protein [Anaerocolumna sedimenticola]